MSVMENVPRKFEYLLSQQDIPSGGNVFQLHQLSIYSSLICVFHDTLTVLVIMLVSRCTIPDEARH